MHPATRIAFYDEMEKIAEVRPAARQNRDNLKRWVKGTLAVAAGTAAGTGAYMLTERAASKLLTKRWAKMKPSTKAAILGPAFAATTLGGTYLMKRLLEERRKYDPR